MNIAVAKKRERPGKKPEIVALATEAFSELGYSAASLRDIGQRAGVTAASLYHHFESKEDLLRFIVDDGCTRLTSALRAELEAPAEPCARLERLVRAHLRFISVNQDVTKIVLEEMRFLSEAGAAPVREQHYAILNIYRDCLKELQAAKGLKGDGVTATAFLAISVINGFYRWFRPEGPMKLEEAIDRAAAFVMAGLDAA
jgi:TetR/AcrR family transcriptional regulator, cholesterol catabolism regulator